MTRPYWLGSRGVLQASRNTYVYNSSCVEIKKAYQHVTIKIKKLKEEKERKLDPYEMF